MFYINKEQLQKVIVNDYNLYSFDSFYNSLDQFLIILTQSDCFFSEFDNLFINICQKCNKLVLRNHVVLISVDGCISIGKSTFIKLLKPNLHPECAYVDEPLSIWQCIYHRDSGLNILEMFYQSVAVQRNFFKNNSTIKSTLNAENETIDFKNVSLNNFKKYNSINGSNKLYDMPYYFQSLVIFSRWLVVVYSKNSNIFLSERSVFSDRYFFIK
jgi:hypothetical protein